MTGSVLVPALLLSVAIPYAWAKVNRWDVEMRVCNGACGTPTIVSGNGEIYAEGDIECDGNLNSAGTCTCGGAMTLDGLTSVCDGACPVFGVAADAGDLAVEEDLEVDGVINIGGASTLAALTQVGANTFDTGSISAGEIADAVKCYPMPIYNWHTDADPPVTPSGTTTPNFQALGNYDSMEWSTGETTQKITTSFRIPPASHYTSTPLLRLIGASEGAVAGAAETYSVSTYASASAISPTIVTETAPAAPQVTTQTETSVTLTNGGIVAGATVRFAVGFTAIDEDMHVITTEFCWTAP